MRTAFDALGFHRRGDLGRLDAQGKIKIMGRVTDMLLRGSRNISLLMIEEHLVAHPAVDRTASVQLV
ncbi:hypothetical protein B1810_21950 [Panacagrimonas perspica]|uniref:hypothetical protein n=1 Tax=Panacagrimonas perspica TaxID=381431 RepID=UPI001060D8CE|nr:hypothetical protein [Panacagrimonas perspica]THD00928.1 hypothetical protein B1810_21950 [Panacagrimonas perspica]